MRWLRFILFSAAWTLVAVSFGACSSSSNSGSSSSSSSSVTFTQVYSDVLSMSCATSGCHVQGGIGVTMGSLDMTTQATAYQNLYKAPAAGTACTGKGLRVDPGNADESVLFQKIEYPSPADLCGVPMPDGAFPLMPTSLITEVETWINEGAPND